jgi:hypothetical protein
MGDALDPVALGTGRTITALDLGERFACGLLDDGSVRCWGDGQSGKLGIGSVSSIGDGPDEMGDELGLLELGSW